jgi:putative ABC transport system permease protein
VTPPPSLASALMRLLLPEAAYEAIAGDVDEDWSTATRRSRARYWRIACASIAAYWWYSRRQPQTETGIANTTLQGDGAMRSLLQDFRYGLRLMRRAPGFAFAAIVTLALGIGANTAIFSLVNVLTLKPLAYRDPHRVAFVLGWNTEHQSIAFNLSIADFADLTRQARSLDSVAAYAYWSANFTGGDVPERVQAYRVTANTFSLLDVPPLIGRTLTGQDGVPGAPGVVVISHGLWERRFGANRSVIGRQVQIDGRPYTVVGVMPGTFEYPVFNFKGDLWAPMQIDVTAPMTDRNASGSVVVVARVRSGLDYATAQAEIDTIMRRLEVDYPQTNRGTGARLIELGKLDDEEAGPAVWILLATVATVLLLACANVANLLLARGVGRQRELAVRAALGAGRRRVMRQLLVESLLLACGGAILGATVAVGLLRMLRGAMPEMIVTTLPNLDALGLDGTTLGFTIALCCVTTLIFGVVPAWRASHATVTDSLRGSTGVGGATCTRRLRTALVVLEVTLSTMLLVTAGLLVQSYKRQQHLDPGFNPHGVMTMTIALPEYRYGAVDAQRRFFEQAAERIARVPGVRAAGFVNVLPFSTYNRGGHFVVEGRPAPEPGREPSADFRIVTPDYLRAMQIRVVRGRALDAGDRADGRRVAMVNETLVRRIFPGEDPTLHQLRLGTGPSATIVAVVGVVADVQHEQLTGRPSPEIYVPQAQSPVDMMMLAARIQGEPDLLSKAIRAQIAVLDPGQPVFHVKTLERLVGDSLILPNASAAMMSLFSVLAVMLAAVGIYGVVAYAVGQQTREIGVRIALGARPGDVAALVLRSGLAPVIFGVLGVAGAVGASSLIANALYGVTPMDPPTYLVAGIVLVAMGALACAVPVWCASRVQPMEALKID